MDEEIRAHIVSAVQHKGRPLGGKKTMELMKLRRSEKGTSGRVRAATIKSGDIYCCRSGLGIMDESLPIRVLRARPNR